MCFKKNCKKLKIKDYRRCRWSFWLLVTGFFSLFVFYYFCKEKFFYLNAANDFENIYRFFWVIPFLFMGFSFFAFYVARKGLAIKDKRPWMSYVFNYFPRLLALSLIIFSVLHLFDSTSGYIYYFLSAGLGLYLGYNVDFVKLEDLAKKR